MKVTEIAELFGVPVEKIRDQYTQNAAQLRDMAKRAAGGKYRGATTQQWNDYAERAEKQATEGRTNETRKGIQTLRILFLCGALVGPAGCATTPKAAPVPKPPATEKQKVQLDRAKASVKSASRFIDVIPFLFLP